MVFGPASKEKVKEWRKTYEQFKDKLSPNRKSGNEVIAYLKDRYLLDETDDEKAFHAVFENVLQNEFWKQKLPHNAQPFPKTFILKNSGEGRELYKSQEDIWKKCPIFIGVDLASGFVQIEGSCRLYDEILAFQGLDKYDLQNIVRVADYINCIKQFNVALYNRLL